MFANWSNGTFVLPTTANPGCLSGDNGTQNTQANYTQTAARSTTTTLIRTVGTPSLVYGSPLTFTATVSAVGGSPGNFGTITFRDGATVLCGPITISSNAATCSPLLDVGSHSVVAEYAGGLSGSIQFNGSTSNAVTQGITARNLTITGATANSKVYDGTTTATVDFSGATLNTVVSGDAVAIGTYTASFATKTVGAGKSVTVTGVALSGPTPAITRSRSRLGSPPTSRPRT